MNRTLSLIFILVLFWSFSSCDKEDVAPFSKKITASDLGTHVDELASDAYKGRFTGTPSEAKAASYITKHFDIFGLKSPYWNGSYIQEFSVFIDSTTGTVTSKNVIGLLDVPDTDQYVVIGAHYDHLGMGQVGSRYDGRREKIHNGADDNASGTAALLELADYYDANPPSVDILFIAFSAEELGLLGSQHYVDNPALSLDNAIAMINLDMVGRLRDNNLFIYGTGTSPKWPQILNQSNSDSLELTLIEEGEGPSDHTSFYHQDIPVLHFFTGTHEIYHTPEDDPGTLNLIGLRMITNMVDRTIQEISQTESLDFTPTTAANNTQDYSKLPLTLDIMPDYSFQHKGLRIRSVQPGGLAAKAGLEDSDVITAINGQSVHDIRSYMRVLQALHSQSVSELSISYLRDGASSNTRVQLK